MYLEREGVKQFGGFPKVDADTSIIAAVRVTVFTVEMD